MPAGPGRVLIVAFDALRPDMVTPELMPNLTAFAEAGVRFSHSRALFPSETRVNQSALVTGCYPARHGIVSNRFLDPVAAPRRLFNTGGETALAEGDRRLGGKLLDAPVLGEILAGHGMQLAVIGAGTPGGTRMLHSKAERLGGFRLSLHRPDASVPAERIAAVIDRLGPIPYHDIPSLSWLTYATDAYLEYVEPELAPDVAILWLCEPDNSYHYRGVGSPENLAAIRHADAEFGRILAHREASDMADRLQIVTISDHGQLTISDAAIELATWFAAGGNAFLGDRVSSVPVGIVDVLPSALQLLGIEAPSGVQRRVLSEALVVAQAGEPPPIAEQQFHAAESGTGIRSYLSVSMVGETSYLNGAWVD